MPRSGRREVSFVSPADEVVGFSSLTTWPAVDPGARRGSAFGLGGGAVGARCGSWSPRLRQRQLIGDPRLRCSGRRSPAAGGAVFTYALARPPAERRPSRSLLEATELASSFDQIGRGARFLNMAS